MNEEGKKYPYHLVTPNDFVSGAMSLGMLSEYSVFFEQSNEVVDGKTLYEQSLAEGSKKDNVRAFNSFFYDSKQGRLCFLWPGRTGDFLVSFDSENPRVLTVHKRLEVRNLGLSSCLFRNGELCNFSWNCKNGIYFVDVDFLNMEADAWSSRAVDLSCLQCDCDLKHVRKAVDMSPPKASVLEDAVYSSICSKLIKIYQDGKIDVVCDLEFPVKADPAYVGVITMGNEEKVVYWHTTSLTPKIHMGEVFQNKKHAKQMEKEEEGKEKGEKGEKNVEIKKDIQIGPKRLVRRTPFGSNVTVQTLDVFQIDNTILTVEKMIGVSGFCMFLFEKDDLSKPVRASPYVTTDFERFFLDEQRRRVVFFTRHGLKNFHVSIDDFSEAHLATFKEFFFQP